MIGVLVEALRARPRAMFWVAALSQAFIWVLVPALIYAAPPGEVPLVLAVGREWLLGSSFGPPLAYWLAEIAFNLFGQRIVGLYVLSQLCVVVTFWAVFALGRSIVGARHAVMAVLLMVGITAFTVPALEFGPAVLAMPLTALALLHCWQAIGEERPRYWFVLGVELGLLVLTTYAGLILIGLIALFIAATARGRATLGTIEPWAAGMIVVLVLFPHLIWLERAGILPAPDLSGVLNEDARVLVWLRLLVWLMSVHAGLLVLLVVAGGVRTGRRVVAPAFAREPLPPFGRAFVYYFALAPALIATLIAALLRVPVPLGGAGSLVVLSGLAVVVAAGDVIKLYRQRVVGVAWLALLLAPPAIATAAVLLAPYTVAADLETGQKTSTTISLSSGLSEADIQASIEANKNTQLAGHDPDLPAAT